MKMRILITSIVDLKKGPHTRLHEFIRYLRKSHDINVLSVNDWWKAGQTDTKVYTQGLEDVTEGVHMEYFTQREISPILQELTSVVSIGKILGNIDSRGFDVHLNYSSLISGYFVARRLRSMGVKTVYDIADDLPQMIGVSPQIPGIARPAGKFIGKIMLTKNIGIASKVTFVDTNIQALYPAPSTKAVVIRNGVDAELFSPHQSQTLKEKLGIGNDFVVGFVGTMREWVEFEPVFAAVSRLSAEHPDIRILIVGEEGGLGKTMNSARKFDVLNKTVFAGTVPYNLVPEYISCMDVCLIPFAKHKGMDAGEDGYCPLKLAEYLACEKPVISTQKTSMPEGIVAYASTAEEYYDRILMMYNNPQLRFEMGSQGRKIIQSSYTWLNSASMLEKVLMEAAS
jgi:glycosyltransferase involved in cell wall biosynthesis